MARSVPVFCKCVGPLTADSLYDYVGSSLSCDYDYTNTGIRY